MPDLLLAIHQARPFLDRAEAEFPLDLLRKMMSMIGRLVNFEGTPAAIATLEQELLDKCLDDVRALPGLGGLHTMVDREAGKLVVLAIWNDITSADGAMSAMVPIRHQIIDGGIKQSMADYEIIS